jgi:hypothetical protein
MGLVAGNIKVTGNKNQSQEELKPATEQVPLKDGEPAVIVDGKVKKISKKSAFLLDMLSLD